MIIEWHKGKLKQIKNGRRKIKKEPNIYPDRSRARSFIKNLATLEDLDEFEKLIKEKRLNYIKAAE